MKKKRRLIKSARLKIYWLPLLFDIQTKSCRSTSVQFFDEMNEKRRGIVAAEAFNRNT